MFDCAQSRRRESQARVARQAATLHFQPRASHRSGGQLAPRDTASDERDRHGDKPVARAPTFDALHRVPRPFDVPGPTGQKQEPGHRLGVIACRARERVSCACVSPAALWLPGSVAGRHTDVRTFPPHPMRLPQVQTFPQGKSQLATSCTTAGASRAVVDRAF